MLCLICNSNNTKYKARTCSRSCGAILRERRLRESGTRISKEYTLADAFVIAAIERINGGEFWSVVANSVGVHQTTLKRRAAQLKLKVRIGQPPSRKMNLITPTKLNDLVYFAALLDTEGHITISEGRNRNLVVVGVCNTYKPIIDWLCSFGGQMSVAAKNKLGKLTCYTWRLVAKLEVKALLEALIPHMRIKKEKAVAAVTYLNNMLNIMPNAFENYCELPC